MDNLKPWIKFIFVLFALFLLSFVFNSCSGENSTPDMPTHVCVFVAKGEVPEQSCESVTVTKACSCGKTIEAELAGLGHDFGVYLLRDFCTRCNAPNLDKNNADDIGADTHVHSYTESVTPSTCTTVGKSIKKCNCGDTIETVLPIVEHTPSAKVEGQDITCTVCGILLANADHQCTYNEIITPSTCTTNGTIIEKCACGEARNQSSLPLADHTPSKTICEVDTVCTVCNKVLTEKMGHKFGAYSTVTEATCTNVGKEKATCSLCGKTDEREIAMTEHTPSAKVDGKDTVCTVCGKVLVTATHTHKYEIKKIESTCVKQGEEKEECACGDVKSTKQLPLAKHTPSETECEKDTVCTVCGAVTAKKTGHKFGEYTAVTKATCSKVGKEKATCSLCGKTDERRIAMTEHTPSAKVDGKDIVCTVCGKVLEAHVHTYKTKTTPSTCVKQGKTEEVCACGDVESTKTLPLAEHTPSAKVVGKDTICTVCGVVLEQGIKPTTGANLTAGEVYQNAYYNTNQLSGHGFSFELSVKKKLLIGSSGMEMRANTETSQEITMGNATLKFPTASHDCRYLYPYILPDDSSGQKYTALVKTKNNSEGWKLPFDLASTKEGLAPAFSSSVFPKMQFANSARDSISVSLTDSEVWMAYGDILNFLIEFASEFDLDLSELTITSATFTATVKNNILSTVEGDFKAKAGKQNIEISFSATYSALNN